MIGERTGKAIEIAVKAEKKHCIEVHGEFKNHHEAWAVLREEVQEVHECSFPFDSKTYNAIDCLWDLVRYDDTGKDAEEQIDQIYEVAEEMAKECIQVMAVCQKWLRLIEKERE